jgi:hypothetical protein
MRQAATAEVCVGAGKMARSSVPLPSTASVDRLLPMPGRLPLPKPVRSAILASEIAGNPANAGYNDLPG